MINSDEARETMRKLYQTKLEILKAQKRAVEQGLIEPCTSDEKIHYMNNIGVVVIDGKIFQISQCAVCEKIVKKELVELWLNESQSTSKGES